jgi:uncharacterized protein (DUF2249 family)
MAYAQTQLDLRGRPPAECLERLLSQFDRLRPGQWLVVTSATAPSSILRLFGHERPGLFEWVELSNGPREWRTQIIRRQHWTRADAQVSLPYPAARA